MDGTGAFEAERGHLFAVAYRMLGSRAEAEDTLQEAYLRWRDVDASAVRDPRAWLTTTVVRLCLDELGSARARRERYVGPWLPEPMLAEPPHDDDPLEQTVLRESASLAFLRVLETLSPRERAVFLLREVFEHSFAEIAEMLSATEDACRKSHQRARDRVVEGRRRRLPPAERERLTRSFLVACASGDLSALQSMLAEDASSISDGGGQVTAARREVRGRDAVSRLMLGLAKKASPDASIDIGWVGDDPAILVRHAGALKVVMILIHDGELVRDALLVLNPDKLPR